MTGSRPAFFFVALAMPTAGLGAPLDIIFESPLETSESQALLLSDAEFFWETVITGYQPGIEIENVTIGIGAFDLDGPNGALAEAGPIEVTTQAGFVLPTFGVVDFDISDLETLEAEGTLFGVLVHEVAHVLGFGTLWADNGLYVDGTGAYTGANAVAAYRAEFDPTAEFVPVELLGGDGTMDSHWDEAWRGGENELMTGFIDPPLFLSDTTVASFQDLGYTTFPVAKSPAPAAVIPLPAGIWLGLSAFGLLGVVSARRSKGA